MARYTFSCIDAHTCGNPVRVVVGGAPQLQGDTMAEKRLDFMARYDWIRTGLMFEPRGHDMMSGSLLYPSRRPDCDIGLVFIETSGCLPMCGHGTIGTVTVLLEHGLVQPRTEGVVALEVPAGRVEAYYKKSRRVRRVRSHRQRALVSLRRRAPGGVPGPGRADGGRAYGGNFYAIIEPQENYPGLDAISALDILRWSPVIRERLNATHRFVHPEDPRIAGLSHVMWTGPPHHPEAHARNAVFYGMKAIDRSPCGTGTSARMAQLYAKGKLRVGDTFVHESIIGSLFVGRVEAAAQVGDFPAIVPSIEGWARVTGFNTIFIDERDPYCHGFQVL
ncbi:4-hydroxyproline epimerase [Rhodothermus marinus]|uniref:4-hydroxyproline epimerase n=1 Tax=Rhodothermus marinus TaxID=29549 RepID=UPI000A8AF8BE|nr:4-hydroxyproline epimerase [Rhodothermus marinus]